MVRRAVADFVQKEINPNVDQWEAEGIAPLKKIFKMMGDLGFLGIRYDPDYGGQGLDYWYDTVFLEELGHIKALGLAVAITVQTHMATPAIEAFGNDHLKNTYLKAAIAGDMVGAIAVTEPEAGSDVAAIRTTARKDGGDFVINGSKMYITNGTQADFFTLLARTGDEPGYHSFSLFVVPSDLPGVTVGRKLDKLGIRISDTAELFFDNVRLPAENLIGSQGEGFIYQMQQFQHERFSLLPFTCIAARDIIESGRNGFLCRGEEEWVRVLRTLAADPGLREKIGREGRRTVAERFSLEVVGRRLVRLLDDLMAGRCGEGSGKP